MFVLYGDEKFTPDPNRIQDIIIKYILPAISIVNFLFSVLWRGIKYILPESLSLYTYYIYKIYNAEHEHESVLDLNYKHI